MSIDPLPLERAEKVLEDFNLDVLGMAIALQIAKAEEAMIEICARVAESKCSAGSHRTRIAAAIRALKASDD